MTESMSRSLSSRLSFKNMSFGGSGNKEKLAEGLDPEKSPIHRYIARQMRMVSTIIKYVDVMPIMFQSLLEAHEALDKGGISVVSNATPLVHRLKQAKHDVDEAIKEVLYPFRDFSASLAACSAELIRADRAKDVAENYRKEIESLNGERQQFEERGQRSPSKGSRLFSARTSDPASRIAKSEDDLQRWASLANATEKKAHELVESCKSRFDEMVESSSRVICTVIKAINAIAGQHVSTQSFFDVQAPDVGDEQLIFKVNTFFEDHAVNEFHADETDAFVDNELANTNRQDNAVSEEQFEKELEDVVTRLISGSERLHSAGDGQNDFLHSLSPREVPNELPTLSARCRHASILPSGPGNLGGVSAGSSKHIESPDRNKLSLTTLGASLSKLRGKLEDSIQISGEDLFEFNDAVFNLPVGTCVSQTLSDQLFQVIAKIHTFYKESHCAQSDARFPCDYIALLGTMQNQRCWEKESGDILLILQEVIEDAIVSSLNAEDPLWVA